MLGPELEFVERTRVIFRGEKYTFFGGNDYHRLSTHPEVQEAFSRALREHGLTSAGSRITTGNHPVYGELERRAADFLGVPGAAVFSSGYLGNLILLQAVARDFQRFFMDEESHFSIIDAIQQPGERIHAFRHGDPADLEKKLREHLRPGEKPLLLTDGVFAGTGEIPPLREYLNILQASGGKILVDDAHALGVVGEGGRGSWEELNVPRDNIFQTGTLSKGVGTFGGVIPGPAGLIERIQESPAFVGSTGMPIPLAAAGIKALEILRSHPEMISGLRERMARVRRRMEELGFEAPDSPAPIVSVYFKDEEKNRTLTEILLKRGIYPSFIRYSGNPPGGHFRFTISSQHGDGEVEQLLEALGKVRGSAGA